jgi:L-methionine (R)-S-oxide reductase
MSEEILDLRGLPRAEAYAKLTGHLHALLDADTDDIAAMATIATLVHHGFGHLWTGFYRVVEKDKLLRVGPYQGSLGCLEIPFGRGVCGDAAAAGKTIIVPDVMEYPGHISCDARSRSEIVVPVLDGNGDLLAVFDIDSAVPDTFHDDDRIGLESLMQWFTRRSRL